MNDNFIEGVIPESLSLLPQLKQLNVNNNILTDPLPTTLGFGKLEQGVRWSGNLINGPVPPNLHADCAMTIFGSVPISDCRVGEGRVMPANGPSSDIDVRWNRDGTPVENESNPDWDPKGKKLAYHIEEDKWKGVVGTQPSVNGQVGQPAQAAAITQSQKPKVRAHPAGFDPVASVPSSAPAPGKEL